MAFLLLAISIRISKSVWFYFDPDLGKQFLQLGLSACFLIGPLLFFYVSSVTGQLDKLRLNWRVHLGALIAVMVVVGVLFPYQSHVALWGDVFYPVINLIWLIYMAIAGWLLVPTLLVAIGDESAMTREQKMSVNVVAGAFVIWVAYFTSSYTSYIVGALSFSVILYLSGLMWFLNIKDEKPKPYANRKLNLNIEENLKDKLHGLMQREALYKNANLTLPELAKRTGVSVPLLSQYLNDNLQKSFSTYINELRIEEAKRLLVADPNLTMELVSEQSGYNAQSTFYNAFKQFVEMTPARYRKQYVEQNSEVIRPES